MPMFVNADELVSRCSHAHAMEADTAKGTALAGKGSMGSTGGAGKRAGGGAAAAKRSAAEKQRACSQVAGRGGSGAVGSSSSAPAAASAVTASAGGAAVREAAGCPGPGPGSMADTCASQAVSHFGVAGACFEAPQRGAVPAADQGARIGDSVAASDAAPTLPSSSHVWSNPDAQLTQGCRPDEHFGIAGAPTTATATTNDQPGHGTAGSQAFEGDDEGKGRRGKETKAEAGGVDVMGEVSGITGRISRKWLTVPVHVAVLLQPFASLFDPLLFPAMLKPPAYCTLFTPAEDRWAFKGRNPPHILSIQ